MDLNLDEYLTGIFAVLAYQGHNKIRFSTGIFDVALVQTLELMEKQMQRERVRPQFKLTKISAAGRSSALNQTLIALESGGVVERAATSNDWSRIVWNKDAGYNWLATTPFPISFFERSGKLFWKLHETARIRADLHQLATRPRPATRKT